MWKLYSFKCSKLVKNSETLTNTQSFGTQMFNNYFGNYYKLQAATNYRFRDKGQLSLICNNINAKCLQNDGLTCYNFSDDLRIRQNPLSAFKNSLKAKKSSKIPEKTEENPPPSIFLLSLAKNSKLSTPIAFRNHKLCTHTKHNRFPKTQILYRPFFSYYDIRIGDDSMQCPQFLKSLRRPKH